MSVSIASSFGTPGGLLMKRDPRVTPFAKNVEAAIEQLRQKYPILIIDDEIEGEGDVCIPAQLATPQIINFMCTACRGIVCQSITVEMARRLDLPLLTSSGSPAFTISVDAASVGSGTSAFDRATTVQTIARSNATRGDLRRPGHVFPLVSRPGGVLERPGHTESSIDLTRLAGYTPSAVICEVMDEDGHMAGPESLKRFAARHGMHTVTVRDLIDYRRQFDSHAPAEAAKFYDLTALITSGNGKKGH